MLGKQIFTDKRNSKTTNKQFSLDNLSAGMYIYKIISNEGQVVKTDKIVIE